MRVAAALSLAVVNKYTSKQAVDHCALSFKGAVETVNSIYNFIKYSSFPK